jgi:hypothetical protein
VRTDCREKFINISWPEMTQGYVYKCIWIASVSVDYDSPKGSRLCQEIVKLCHFNLDFPYLVVADTPFRQPAGTHYYTRPVPEHPVSQSKIDHNCESRPDHYR